MKSRRLSRGAALSARLARTRAEAEDLAATVNIEFERLPCGEGERPQMSQALIRATVFVARTSKAIGAVR